MADYNINRLQTLQECDDLLQRLNSAITVLKDKKGRCEKKIAVHRRIVEKVASEEPTAQTTLKSFNLILAGNLTRQLRKDYEYKKAQAQCRLCLYAKQLEQYSTPALLIKELALQRTERELIDTEALATAVKERMDALTAPAELQVTVSDTSQPTLPYHPFKKQPNSRATAGQSLQKTPLQQNIPRLPQQLATASGFA